MKKFTHGNAFARDQVCPALIYDEQTNNITNSHYFFRSGRKEWKALPINQIERIMKLTILLLIFFLQVGAKGVSQSITLSEKNAPLTKVLKEIEQQTDYLFFYEDAHIRDARAVSIQCRNMVLEEVLKKCFKDQPLTYNIVEKVIIVKPGQASPSKATATNAAAFISVKGRVTNKDGEPVIGATVVVRGTQKSAMTDASGKFSLTDVPENAVILISSIGYLAQEVTVNNQNEINVILKEQISALNQVIVVGYGTEKKATLTGAVAAISGKEIKDAPVANLSNALAGRLPGVSITQTGGKPGKPSSISIRAVGTWNNTDPLYVIDGVVRDKFAFDALDPSEVENLSVLKDGASASVYGSRAANGVILVTTKKGKEGKTTISYTGTVGVDQAIRIPATQNAYNQALTINDALRVDNVPSSDSRFYTPDELDYFKTHDWNWINEAWKNPVTTRHALSVSGGTSKVRYFMNGAYYYGSGSFNRLDFKKYTLRANIEADITKDLTASLNVSTDIRNDQKPYWRWDGDNDDMEDLYKAFLFRTHMVPPYINGKLNGTFVEWSPLAIVQGKTGYNKKKYSDYNAIAALQYKIPFVPGLDVKIMFNKYSRHTFIKQFSLPYELTVFARSGQHNHIVTDKPESVKVRDDGEFLYESYDNPESYQLNGYVTYNRSFGLHKINALFVYEQAEGNDNTFNAKRNNFTSPLVDQLFAGSLSSQFANGSGWEDGRLSYVGRVNYNYADKYIVEGAFRYDGSVKFAPGRRWGFFPSLAAAWRISEEPFFKNNVKFINDLKLRGSVAMLGNDAVGGWQWMQRYNIYTGAVFGNTTAGIAPVGLPNPDITWEKSLSWNGGLDAVLLDSKLNFSAEVFRRHTYDILGARQQSVPSTFGATLPAENYGIIDSKGFELSAGYNNTIGKDFRYTIAANMGYATNKVIMQDQPENQRAYKSVIGYSTDRIWGMEAIGILRTQADLDALPAGYTIFGQKPELGMMNYRDIRGAVDDKPDGKIDDNDAQYIGKHSTPPVNYGIALGAAWKGLSLDLLFQGLAGHQVMIDARYVQARAEETNFAFWNDHWTPENTNAAFPRANRNTGDNPSTFWLRNGSFLRLKNINLSYELPKQIMNRAGISSLRLFFIGTNLFLLEDHVKFRDPEAASMRSYPLMKNYSLGVNITL